MLDTAVEKIMGSPPGMELLNALEGGIPGRWVRATGISGSLDSLLVAGLSRQGAHQMLIICPDPERAERVADDLAVCLGGDAVILYGGQGHRGRHDGEGDDARTLRALTSGSQVIVVAKPSALADPLPDRESVVGKMFRLQRGETYTFKDILARLTDNGYSKEDLVDAAGDVAIRGGIVDIFPFGLENPVRLEFFGDTLESIREFDPVSQRSIRTLDGVLIIPDIHQANAAGASSGGSSLAGYFDAGSRAVVLDSPAVHASLAHHLQVPAGDDMPARLIESATARFVRLTIDPLHAASGAIDFGSRPQRAFNGSIPILRETLGKELRDGYSIVLMADGHAELGRLRDLLMSETREYSRDQVPDDAAEDEALDLAGVELSPVSLHEGFVLPSLRHAVYTEHQIFNRLKRRGRRRPAKFRGLTEKEFQLLRPGDFVVHEEYGIGRYEGLKKIRVRDVEQEVVSLRYDGGDRLYVNLTYVNKLQRYSSREGHIPALTRLGSLEWERLKARAKKRVKDIARDLIRLYAQRKNSPGFTFQPDTPWQQELEASFMYEDTFDQARATRDVKGDMEADWPMDRLVCGDVGFGKTEVAVRAAFKAVLSGKQVAVLVPTTILALQHHNTFVDRLSRYALRINVLSRFKSKREQTEILERLAGGSLDIVIGTHRLLSSDVRFKDLGLLIIDEEHRFGVSAKEKLRKARVNVDTLALTATPIPRTLHFSLLGARDLSVIATPPRNRRPVITEITEWNDALISEAVSREVGRGGQVFFVHDRIQNMDDIVQRLRRILGNIRIRSAHGQMSARELEEVMLEFLERRFDVLVSTKIIESGLDMPNVNTMVINRADRFGMAELYQLRGRVGRSNVQAYAYLLTPPPASLPTSTIRRLQAVEEFTELGSGFNLAMRDLEIRGMGNLLGSEQSGFIENMGFETYTKILEEAVRELKEEDFKELFKKDLGSQAPVVESVVEPDFPAYIPEEYVGNDTERLSMYRRIYRLTSEEQLAEVEAELQDRFGKPPSQAESLFALVRLKMFGSKNGLRKIRVGMERAEVGLPPESDAEFYDGEKFRSLMKKILEPMPERPKLNQDEKALVLLLDIPGAGTGREAAETLLMSLRKLLSADES